MPEDPALDPALLYEHEAAMESAWHGLEAVFEISDLNLCGYALLDAREVHEAGAALWRSGAAALARPGAGREALNLARTNIAALGSLAAELAGLNERALVNPYSRLRGPASFVPSEGVLRRREMIPPFSRTQN
jgi:hypothetical protein